MKLYAIFDRTAHNFGAPMMFENDDLAKRTIQMALKDGQLGKTINAYPGDFELNCIGEYKTDDGIIVPEVVFMIRLSDLLEVPNNG